MIKKRKYERQERYQLKMWEQDKCPKCGRETLGYYYCPYHRAKDRIRLRKKYRKENNTEGRIKKGYNNASSSNK